MFLNPTLGINLTLIFKSIEVGFVYCFLYIDYLYTVTQFSYNCQLGWYYAVGHRSESVLMPAKNKSALSL